MTPAHTDRTTNSATESTVTPAEGDVTCAECGHEVVTELLLITMGTYAEIVCVDPWACWERHLRIPT